MGSAIYICTPSLNSEETIEKTINSVINQSANFEVYYIVKDSGSTDGTISILKRIEKKISENRDEYKNVKFSFESSYDEGIYDSITKGFDFFSGLDDNTWLTWINPGDTLEDGALSFISNIKDSNINWVSGRTSDIDINGHRTNYLMPINSYIIKCGIADGLHWGFQQQEGSFFRYKLWSRTKLRAAISKYQYAGDWKLWVEFAKEEQLYQVDKTLGKFNLSSGRLNNIFSSEYFNEINNDISLAERSGLFSDLENIDDLKRLEIDEQYNILEKSLSGAVTYWLSRRKKEPNFKYIKNTYRRDNLIAYDDEWQFPAITEKHAFNKVKELGMSFNGDVVYFGFPWASLIDLYHNKKPDGDILLEVLSKYKDELSRYKRVVTVCQHIFAIKYKSLLEKVGVTDIFWTHKITGQNVSGNLNIHSFPLYPVQAININVNRETDEYKYLFSFVGAKSNQWYLTQSRTYILEELSDTPGALVKGRDNWHYNTAVYDHQVNQSISNLQPLVDEDKSSEFKDVMDKTLFSLCPSGSGPNSIRLWESLGYGAIPVILADTYEPPGDISLWEQAVVFCKEDRESISKLPSLLSELSQDMVKIENMKHIGKQLWLKYGPDAFIYDVVKFMSKPDCDNEDSPSYHSLNSIDYYVKLNRNLDFCSGLPAKSINTKMLVNSDLLLKEIESSDDSELLLKKIFSKHREERLLFNKLAKAKNFKYTI